MRFTVFILFLFSVNTYASSDCENLKSSSRLTRLISQIKAYSDQRDIWPGQHLSNYAYVLTDLEVTKTCAVVIYDNFKQRFVQTNSPITYANSVFAYFLKNSPSKNIEIQNFLDSNQIEFAYAQNFTNVLEQVPRYQFHIYGFQDGNVYLYLLLHEGFHLFTQFGSSRNWLTWTYMTSFDRDEVSRKCYEDERVVLIFEKEYEALLSAFQFLEFYKNLNYASDALDDYYKHRESRHSILSDVTIYDELNDTHISCKQAEVVMEHREGLAEFFGNLAMYNSGLMNNYQLFANLREKRKGDAFYGVGMVKQLFLYRKLESSYTHMVQDMLHRDDPNFNQDFYVKKNL